MGSTLKRGLLRQDTWPVMRELRLRKGYTQAILGGMCNIGQIMISQAETGRVNLNSEELARVADVLDFEYPPKELTMDWKEFCKKHGLEP